MSDEQFCERWVGSRTPPIEAIEKHARVRSHDGRRPISYPDQINGAPVLVDMPEDAPTKSCQQNRHDACPHRLGGPQQGGVTLKLSLPGFPGGADVRVTETPSVPGACSDAPGGLPPGRLCIARAGRAPFFLRPATRARPPGRRPNP